MNAGKAACVCVGDAGDEMKEDTEGEMLGKKRERDPRRGAATRTFTRTMSH